LCSNDTRRTDSTGHACNSAMGSEPARDHSHTTAAWRAGAVHDSTADHASTTASHSPAGHAASHSSAGHAADHASTGHATSNHGTAMVVMH
jgi:hypothetical protein